MLTTILGAIVAISLSIIANFLTPFIQELFKSKSVNPPEAPEPETKKIQNPESNDIKAWRAQNKAKLEAVVSRVYFYGFSYFAMYLAFYVPISLHGGFYHPSINLMNSKLEFDYLIDNENISTVCAIFGVLAYIPFWKLSQLIADLISYIVIRFTFVNEAKYLAFTVLAMIFWSFFIAGNVSWLLNVEAGWLESIKFSLILWFLLFFSTLLKQK